MLSKKIKVTTCVVAGSVLLTGSAAAFAAQFENFDMAAHVAQNKRFAAGVTENPALWQERRIVQIPLASSMSATFNAVIDPQRAARNFLAGNAARYGTVVAGADALVPLDTQRLSAGGHVVRFTPQRGGIEIFRETVGVVLDPAGNPRVVSGAFNGAAVETVAADGRRGFQLSAADAAALALQSYGGVAAKALEALKSVAGQGSYTRFTVASKLASGAQVRELRTKPVWYRVNEGLVPAYYVETQVIDKGQVSADYYAQVVAADDGRLLFRMNQVADAAFKYRVFAENSGVLLPFPGPGRRGDIPHPTAAPDGSAPSLQPSQEVTIDYAPLASVFPGAPLFADPWLPNGATVPTGNNAEAFLDIDAIDGPSAGDVRAQITAPGEFTQSYDLALAPGASTVQRQAASLQQFYVVNYLHDWFYLAGFDEAAGNAQTNNFGRGGLGNDSIRAEGQDASGTNNANMATPADGGRPRMQMYRFSGPVNASAVLMPGGNVDVAQARFGPTAFNLNGTLVAGIDTGVSTTDACEALVNDVAGKIVLVDRGNCNFTLKVKNAQTAGAIGVLIANNVSPGYPPMGDGGDGPITTPSFGISQADGVAIRTAIGNGLVSAVLAQVSEVERDGTIDTGIIAHEWGHYISNRLIGNGSGLNNQQGSGMGEGWGDFHALLLLTKEEDSLVPVNDQFNGTYATGSYVVAGFMPSYSKNASYFGIRRYPYSSDMTKNGLTFKHIGAAALPNTPISPSAVSANNFEVHNVGEIWASMLWECYSGLLRETLKPNPRYNFNEARRRMSEYLVAGYKMTPSSPTMVEARDALLAGIAVSDPEDLAICGAAFAKRGAGLRAVAPSRSSANNSGVVEQYESGGDLAATKIALIEAENGCDGDGILDVGESGFVRVAVRNTGWAPLSHTTVDIGSGFAGNLSFPSGTTAIVPPLAAGIEAEVDVPVTLLSSPDTHAAVALSATPNDIELAFPSGIPLLTSENAVEFDEIPNSSKTESFEVRNLIWTPAIDGGFGSADGWRRIALGDGNFVAFSPDNGAVALSTLTSPLLQLSASGSFSFTFKESHSFEYSGSTYYDGGVIQISVDGGNTWLAIPANAITPTTLTGTLATDSGNPLAGANAFVAKTTGYPDVFTTRTVDFGTTYQGQAVRIRFVVATDEAADAPGWEIDEVSFTGIDNMPFGSIGPDAGVCNANNDTIFEDGFE